MRTAAPTPAPGYCSGALASHPSGQSLNLPATLCSSVNRRYGIPLQGAAAISEMNIRKVSGTLDIVLHLAPPERRPEGVEAPDRGGRRVERGQGMQRPLSRLRRTPRAPAPRGGPGHARGSGLGRRTRPNHLGHRFQPAGTSRPQVKLSRLLTSDSRRWLLNASRPLGAACFPLPPPLPLPLPLPLAGGLPAPGAAESSMRLWSAAPPEAQRSLLQATPPPRAASQAPPPPQLLAAVASPSPAPRRNWLFYRSERDWRRWGLIQGIFFSLVFFSVLRCHWQRWTPGCLPASLSEFWDFASHSASLCTQPLPNNDLFASSSLHLLLHCSLLFPITTDPLPSNPGACIRPKSRSCCRGGMVPPPQETRDSPSLEAQISVEISSL